MTEYLDFEIEIGIGIGREYPIAVIRSPGGEAREQMIFPFDELALDGQLKDLQIALLRSGGQHRLLPTPQEQTIQDFGQKLFAALMTGEVRSRFDVSQREAGRQGKGLRIKLRIQSPELACLPWEFMYDPREGEYVCLSTQTPMVRYIELPHIIEPLTVIPPLRILGLIASPCGLALLNVENEKHRMETALRDLIAREQVSITWQEHVTWYDLQRLMRNGQWNIVHFIGHGSFDRLTDEGLIALEDEDGNVHLLPASQLARLLADHPSLRLVVLNACEGGQGSNKDIFSSTASILVRRGIPAVLAMQYAITDRAAVEFGRGFYEAIADGLPVDAAVTEARKSISIGVANTLEWGTPVLFMHTPDGVLFRPETTTEKAIRLQMEKQKRERARREAETLKTRLAAEKAAHEAAEKAAKEKAALEQARREAERLAMLKAEEERLAYEKAEAESKAREEAEKLARAKAEREAQRLAAEKTAKEEAERAVAEKAAREEAERAAAENAAKEVVELATRQQAERDAQRLAAEKKAKKEAERQAAEKAAKEAQELAGRQQAEREAQRMAAEKAAKEKAEREAAQKVEQDALELAARTRAEEGADEKVAAKQLVTKRGDQQEQKQEDHVDLPKKETEAVQVVTKAAKRKIPLWGVIIAVMILLGAAAIVLPQILGLSQTASGPKPTQTNPILTEPMQTAPAAPVLLPTLPPPPTEVPPTATPTQITEIVGVMVDANHASGLDIQLGGDFDVEVVTVGENQEKAFRTGNGKSLPSYDHNSIVDNYMQLFILNDALTALPNGRLVQIEVEYLDVGTDRFFIEYDAQRGGPYGNGKFMPTDPCQKTNSGEFKTAVFKLNDAYFNHRDNSGDFRISPDSALIIRRVSVILYP